MSTDQCQWVEISSHTEVYRPKLWVYNKDNWHTIGWQYANRQKSLVVKKTGISGCHVRSWYTGHRAFHNWIIVCQRYGADIYLDRGVGLLMSPSSLIAFFIHTFHSQLTLINTIPCFSIYLVKLAWHNIRSYGYLQHQTPFTVQYILLKEVSLDDWYFDCQLQEELGLSQRCYIFSNIWMWSRG